jgi:hypothetical protein
MPNDKPKHEGAALHFDERGAPDSRLAAILNKGSARPASIISYGDWRQTALADGCWMLVISG